MIIHLIRPARGTNARSRSCGTVVRRYPRINRAGCPSFFFFCPPWGFSCLANSSASGELLPSPFHPCLRFSQRTGGVFSVTLSVNPDFGRDCPRILRGMLPYGVRTFLQQALRLTSDHLPSTENLAQEDIIWKPGRYDLNRENRNFLSRNFFCFWRARTAQSII